MWNGNRSVSRSTSLLERNFGLIKFLSVKWKIVNRNHYDVCVCVVSYRVRNSKIVNLSIRNFHHPRRRATRAFHTRQNHKRMTGELGAWRLMFLRFAVDSYINHNRVFVVIVIVCVSCAILAAKTTANHRLCHHNGILRHSQNKCKSPEGSRYLDFFFFFCVNNDHSASASFFPTKYQSGISSFSRQRGRGDDFGVSLLFLHH